jgi:glycosyltransferase involved in cell wall biosynthesis
MKIVLLMPLSDQRGGAEQLLRNFLPHLHRYPVRWTIVFFEEGPMCAEAQRFGAETVVIPTGRLRNPLSYLRAIRQIAAVLHQTQADLVFSWMSKAHLYGSLAGWLTGVPAAWYQHDIPETPGWIDRLITALPARVILTCSAAAARAQDALRPHRATSVVHPCVDLDRFDPDRLPTPDVLRRKFGLPTNAPIVGIVSRMQRWKGIHVFVDAMKEVLHHYPTARGLIVGGRHALEPDYEAKLDAQISALGLSDRILRVGFQSSVAEWMQTMDVVVHASDREPFGMVVIEAMALAKPVVAGREGGPREIITEGEDGLLAPFGDSEALALQVVRYLDDHEFSRRTATAARRRATTFSATAYADRLVEALTVAGSPSEMTVSAASPAPRVSL